MTDCVLSTSSAASAATAAAPSSVSDGSASATSPAVTAGTTGIAAYSCGNDSVLSSSEGVRYRTFCEVDWPGGSKQLDGKSNVKDVQALMAYTMEACIAACDARNVKFPGQCQAVTYHANLTAGPRGGGNCVLKNARAEEAKAEQLCISAVVVS